MQAFCSGYQLAAERKADKGQFSTRQLLLDSVPSIMLCTKTGQARQISSILEGISHENEQESGQNGVFPPLQGKLLHRHRCSSSTAAPQDEAPVSQLKVHVSQEQEQLSLCLQTPFPHGPDREKNKVLPLQKSQKPLPKDTEAEETVVQNLEVVPACSLCKMGLRVQF